MGGVLARDKRYKDRRIGFELLDLGSGATGMLADETGDGPQLGKYRVHLDDLDRIGARAVENALKCDPIIVDEIGHMELSSHSSILAVEKAIASPKTMLVVLHEWSRHRLAKKIRGSFKVITATQRTRMEKNAKEITGEELIYRGSYLLMMELQSSDYLTFSCTHLLIIRAIPANKIF